MSFPISGSRDGVDCQEEDRLQSYIQTLYGYTMHDLALPTAIIAVENGRSVSQKPSKVEEGQVVRSTCLEADSRQYVQVDDGQS